jgi:hypothetical protein
LSPIRETNPLTVNGHPAWGSEFNLATREVRPLNPITNTWCATGGFVSNGTFFSVGGHPMQGASKLRLLPFSVFFVAHEIRLGATGLQSIRIFEPCTDETCDVFEDLDRLRLTSARWYPSSVCLVIFVHSSLFSTQLDERLVLRMDRCLSWGELVPDELTNKY